MPLWAKDLSPKVRLGDAGIIHTSTYIYQPNAFHRPTPVTAAQVAVIDPSLTTTLAPPARRGMALAALSVAFDALACGSARGKDVLRGAGGGGGSGGDSMADLILAAARGVSAGLAAEGRPEVLAPGAQR